MPMNLTTAQAVISANQYRLTYYIARTPPGGPDTVILAVDAGIADALGVVGVWYPVNTLTLTGASLTAAMADAANKVASRVAALGATPLTADLAIAYRKGTSAALYVACQTAGIIPAAATFS